jgi:hypothetical protein
MEQLKKSETGELPPNEAATVAQVDGLGKMPGHRCGLLRRWPIVKRLLWRRNYPIRMPCKNRLASKSRFS